jgi:probable rRNA maturation factor
VPKAASVNIFWKTDAAASQKPSRATLSQASLKALGRHGARGGELNLIFVGKAEIRRLNRRFLSRNRMTDVIAFSYPQCAAGEKVIGDVYVCADAAAAQAKRLGHSLKKELLLLALHGALHLAGMEDADDAQRGKMHRAAEKIAAEF